MDEFRGDSAALNCLVHNYILDPPASSRRRVKGSERQASHNLASETSYIEIGPRVARDPLQLLEGGGSDGGEEGKDSSDTRYLGTAGLEDPFDQDFVFSHCVILRCSRLPSSRFRTLVLGAKPLGSAL
jgi:hypothetical protein